MAKAIDGNWLYEKVEARYRVSTGIEHRCERDFLDLICNAPTLAPQNEWVEALEAINNAAVAYIEGGPYENDLPGMEFAVEIDRLSRDFVRPPNEPLTCGLVDRHGMPLRAGDTVAADKFFVYAVRYGSHNVNPDNCAQAYQVGWYLEIMWAYPGFEDSVGHTEPLYDIDGTAARYPAHCADTADGLYNLKLEVCCRPPEGEEDT